MKNLSIFLLLSFILISCGKDTPPMNNNNDLPSVSIDALDVLEGDEDKSVFASVRLSRAATETIEIFVETVDGTAEANLDYTPIDTKITIAPGAVQENIKLTIIGDDLSEKDEQFSLNITSANGATIGTNPIAIIIKNDDLGDGNVAIPSGGYSTPMDYESMNLVWNDEFSDNTLNEAFWTYEIGNGEWGWGNNELQFYRKENTSLVDGHLVIEARNEFFNGFEYTSSRIITKDKFEFKYGRVDIRAALPEGQGLWPALWMLGANISEVGWPQCGEIDIMELVGNAPSTVHATVHYQNAFGDHTFLGNETSLSGGKKFSQEFHVFSLVWEENSVKFYLDDNLYHTITPGIIGGDNPYPFNEPFFFIMNVAVGGLWPGEPDDSTNFPQHMIVDYIRVFQKE